MNDNHAESIREKLIKRLVKIGIILCILAIIEQAILLPQKESFIGLGILLLCFIIAYFFAYKINKIIWAEFIVGVSAIFLVFPLTYFTSGGIRGGATVWFIMGIFYVIGLYDGFKMYLFLTMTIATFVATYIVGYFHPEMIIEFKNEGEIIADSLFAVIFVGILLGAITKFQLKSYDSARKFALNQRDEIEDISNRKNSFFTSMSHEIRTPINSIIGLSEIILREENLSDELLEDVEGIQNESKMLLAMVNDILDLSRIENKMMELDTITYSTEEMFSDLVEMFRYSIEEKKLEFVVEVDRDMPSLLKGDSKRIKQVVINLLSNALKYTKEGSIIFSVKADNLDDLVCRMTISVEDTGIGIKTENFEHLFDSFTSTDNKKNIEGRGLGLSISKQLIDLMDGEITVDSIYTKGSKFTVILYQPIIDHTPIGTIDFMANKSNKRLLNQQLLEAPEARILLAFENENDKIVCSKLLRNTKLIIDSAKNKEEVLEATLRKYYHIILIDDSMVKGNNEELIYEAVRFQENGLCKDTPMILLTSENNENKFKMNEEHCFSALIEKPFNGIQLESTIMALLPDEMIEYKKSDANRIIKSWTGDTLIKNISKKKRSIISTECVSDITEAYAKQLGVELVYLYVNTPVGRFKDTIEMDVDNYAELLKTGVTDVYASTISVEDYLDFFARLLTEAEEVIHISFGKDMGKSYVNALEAARCFGSVTVIDSGHIASGMGIVVSEAARLLSKGGSTKEVLEYIYDVEKRVQSKFLFGKLENVRKNGYISNHVGFILDMFNVHTIYKMKNSKIKLSEVMIGDIDKTKEKFIIQTLKPLRKKEIKQLWISYTDTSVKQQEFIDGYIKNNIKCDNVIFRKTSVTNACFAGRNSISIAYLEK